MYVKQSNLFLFSLIGIISLFGLSSHAYADVKLDPTPYYYNDNGTFVPYKLINTSNNATVIINSGSFVFDKNTCSISFYNKTSASGSPVVSSDTYQVLASNTNNGTSGWNPVGIINNAACSTSIVEHNGTISIAGTKTILGGGSFTVNYTKSPFNPLKLTFSATNSNPAWTNYHIGIRELIQVPKIVTLGNTTYDLSQHNNTGLNRAFISSHRSQVITLSNNLKYNMGLGWNNANSITDIWKNNQATLQIDYTYNTQILSPGNTITIDPSFDTSAICRTDSATTCSVTVGNNPNRLLVAVMHYGITKATSYAPTAVKIGTTSFTKLTDKEGDGSANGAYVSVWYLANPPIGSQTVTVTWGSSTPPYSEIGLISFYNVKQSQPINPSSFTTAGNAASASETISITPTIQRSWIAAVCTSMEDCNTPSGTSIYTSFPDTPGTQIIASSQYNSAPTIGSSNTFSWGGTAVSTVGTAKIAFEIENNKSPTIPVLTKVNTINSTTINATWSSVPNAQWYQLNKTTPIGGTMTQYANTTSLFQVITGLTPGTQYQFILAAGNSTGISLGSVTKYNYTFNVAPTIPTLSSITVNQMRLGWTNPTGGANLTGGFNIYKVTALGSNYTLLAQTSNNTNHYDPTSLQGNREYTFKVATRYAVGTNYTGVSANSTTVTAYTLPTTPTGLAISQSVALTAHLSWSATSTDNGTLLGTKIEQSTDGGSTWTTKIANTGNATTHADIVESSAGTFYFRVSSIKYGGTSLPSSSASRSLWNYFTVNEYHHDGTTPVYGEAIQSNTTSTNNRFTLVSGSVQISGISQLNNFTAWNSLINFIVGKQYNYNSTTNHSLNMTTNDYDVDCASTGTGVDVEVWTNGTDGHRISTFTTPTCFANNTMKWTTKFTANGNNAGTFSTNVYVRAVNATFGTVAPLKYNQTQVTTVFSNPYIISNPVTVGTGLQTRTFNWSMNLTVSPAFTPVNFTVGHISVSGVNPVTMPIKFTTTAVNSSATSVAVTFPSTYTMAYQLTYGNEGKTQTLTGLPVTTPSLGVSQSVITFKNPSNDFVTIKAYDTVSNTTASTILSQPNTNIPFVTQFKNFKNGLFGTSAMIGGINIIDLIVLIVAMIGLNRANEIVGAFMMVIIVGVAGFFQIITWPTALVSAIALAVLVTVVTMKKYQNS